MKEIDLGKLNAIERLTFNRLANSVDRENIHNREDELDGTFALRKLISAYNKNKAKELPDYIVEYIENNLVRTKSMSDRIKTKDLYEHYLSSAEKEGYPDVSKQMLSKALLLNRITKVNIGNNLKAYSRVRFKTNEDLEWEI